MPQIFTPLPDKPDHNALELAILESWEREGTFEQLREENRGGPTFSFVDGPVTANKTLAVHTAWGRTLKDVFQRYKGLRGFDQRYQNGFDCQGLWIEVGVERELGLNSKRDIEDYGLAEFARRCREKVIWSATELTRGSKRLGQWMDWGNDYFTFSDTNIEYIWGFLKRMWERGMLYKGHRSTEWCPRCGTSISQHELTQSGVYQDRSDPSLYVRFPLLDRKGESLVVWTTTPWTLPANVAAAVKADAEYGRRENGEWVAAARYPDESFVETAAGSELVGLRYRGPFDDLPPAADVEHRVIPWDEVSLEEGTGIVHIAPGAGQEDFELGRVHGLPVLSPVDEAGRFYDSYGWLHGLSTTEAADQIVGRLAETGFLLQAGMQEHRYPHCWRCDTPLIWRVTDDWLIAVDDLRQQLLDANATVEWTPAYMGKRMDDWLRNMGDWNISRRRYYGLPLPIYECESGHVTVVGSKAELAERAVSGLDQLEELRRPWVDEVPISCESCGETVRRIPEVGDVWLDAGIVPFSTLGWQSDEYVVEGYATGAAKGLTTADLPDHAYWETWFPADWVSEMREQIRLWFYSQHFMSVALTGRAPYRRVLGYEKMLDEHGREMHGSWGNMIDAEDAFERMGADVMRWQYCAQPPNQNLLFGFGPAHEIKRKLLTLWNSCKFLVDYANIDGWEPTWADLADGPGGELEPLDRWLVERTRALVAESTAGYENWLSVDVVRAYEAFIDDVSNWYIRRSRRRFWDADPVALRTLWFALVQGLRVVAPLMPFLTDHLWRVLTAPVCRRAGVRPSRGVARDARAGRRAPRRDRRAPSRGRARSPGAGDLGHEAAAAAPRARRRGRAARGEPRRRGRGRAPGARGLVRTRRGERASREAEPARARAEARQGARRRALCAAGRRLRGAPRRRRPRRRATTSPATRSSSSARGRTAGRSPPPTGSRSRSTSTSTTTSSAQGASTTSSTRSTRCARSRGSRSPIGSRCRSPSRTRISSSTASGSRVRRSPCRSERAAPSSPSRRPRTAPRARARGGARPAGGT